MRYYLLGLGSNIQPDQHLARACSELAQRYQLLASSPVIATPTEGSGFHYPFRNQLALIATGLDATHLKQELLKLEADFGREPKSPERKHHDRTIDVDILVESNHAEDCLREPLQDRYYQAVMEQWPAAQTLKV